MMFLILVLIIIEPSIVSGLQEYETNINEPLSNSSDGKKDMFVIHAMVYQVGIITNKTSNETESNIGKQESVTFFHSNGSKVDFSKIPQPILTNVTAQSLVGIAPSASAEQSIPMLANISNWNLLQHKGTPLNQHGINEMQAEDVEHNPRRLYKRDNAIKVNETVKIVKGSALIPKEAGVRSIAILPLLALNNNFTNIPVPIPNTSIVHYAKINTIVHNPEVL